MAEPRVPRDNIDEASAPLEDRDHRRLSRVERSLQQGLALRDWWRQKTRQWAHEYDGRRMREHLDSGAHPESFPLLRSLPQWGDSEVNYGYFDQAPVHAPDELKPVMGIFQQTVFDDPKLQFVAMARDSETALNQWAEGFRTFARRYLIRLTSLQRITPYVDDKRSLAGWLQPISWWPRKEESRGGFAFSQIYYKRRDDGRVGKFREADRDALDLRQLKETYAWMVIGVRIYDVYLRYPGGPDTLRLPIDDEVLSIVSTDFLIDERVDDGKVRGRHGFGYAFLEDPREEGDLLPWSRPRYGVQFNDFVVLHDGRILCRTSMVSEKLQKLLDINVAAWSLEIADRLSLRFLKPFLRTGVGLADRVTPQVMGPLLTPVKQVIRGLPVGPTIDPVSFYANVANLISGGAAGRQLGISPEVALKSLLGDFARSAQLTISDARSVWRAIPDWQDEGNLPAWVGL